MLNTILNVLWFLSGGVVIAIEYAFAGLILCLTVVGIPFGLQCFKLAGLALWPFGKDIEQLRRRTGGDTLGAVGNIVWFVFAGLWIFLSHVSLAVGLFVSIIGIPFAFQHLKLGVMSLTPFGRVSV